MSCCVVSQVKEKQQARKEYKQAIERGHGAYLMDQDAPVSLSIPPYLCRHTLSLYIEQEIECVKREHALFSTDSVSYVELSDHYFKSDNDDPMVEIICGFSLIMSCVMTVMSSLRALRMFSPSALGTCLPVPPSLSKLPLSPSWSSWRA